MSDRSLDLRRCYGKSIGDKDLQPFSRALFPIPEYPEYEARGMWTALLSSLRRLSPAALLTFLWGQYHLVYALLGRLETAVRSLIFSSDAHTESVLRWVSESGPTEVTDVEEVWRNGWIVCALVERAMPGACAGHRRATLSIEHAQTLAEQYLGVQPVFSCQELESPVSLSKEQKWKLAHYLDRLRHALGRISPPVSKPNSPRISSESQAYTLDYVARGIGLGAAQTNKKMCFKVYPTAQQCMEPGEINVLIRGPNDTYGTAVIKPLYGRAQLLRQTFLGLDVKTLYPEITLPLTQGNTYLRSYGKTDFNKTFYIPKDGHNIDIETIIRRDHVKVFYLASMDGIYEISLTSQGYNLIGSPFKVIATEENIEFNANADLDDDDECGITDVNNDKRIVFRIVDFVTEKMILNNNGTLERISDEEAVQLITTAQKTKVNQVNNNTTNDLNESYVIENNETKKSSLHYENFQAAAKKIIKMIEVCRIFQTILKTTKQVKHDTILNRHIDIPDIVHSMIFDKTPEDAVSVNVNENSYHVIEDKFKNATNLKKKCLNDNFSFEETIDNKLYDNESKKNTTFETTQTNVIKKDIVRKYQEEATANSLECVHPGVRSKTKINEKATENSTEKSIGDSINYNPFHEKVDYKYSFLPSEQLVTPVEILIEPVDEEPKVPVNPFVDIEIIERPKTPILKILNGEIKDRDDSIIADTNLDVYFTYEERCKSNEFLNPFYLNQINNDTETMSPKPSTIADFLIGAPVSLPQFRNLPSPEPDMNSIILASNLEEALQKYDKKVQNLKHNKSESGCDNSIYDTPLPSTPDGFRQELDSTFYSSESNLSEPVEYFINNSNNNVEIGLKDLWDSAYVSIDEANSSADNNNNSDTPYKIKVLEDGPTANYSDSSFFNMGPAEREIWIKCANVETALVESKVYDMGLPETFENKKTTFAPIIEEVEQSCSPMQQDILTRDFVHEAKTETKLITASFPKLGDTEEEYIATCESSTMTKVPCKEPFPIINFVMEQTHRDVNSSSEYVSDVKRHGKDENKAVISEVQFLATESSSVSQAPKNNNIFSNQNTKEQIQVTIFDQFASESLVNEKKKYWDEKIKSIEEINAAQKRITSPSKQADQNRPQSYNRRQYILKEPVDLIFSAAETDEQQNKEYITDKQSTVVDKFKEKGEDSINISGSPTITENVSSQIGRNSSTTVRIEPLVSEHMLSIKHSSDPGECISLPERDYPLKLDVTDEKVFEAFETSPKRFFGNSRNNILEKIDSFLGKINTNSINSSSRSVSRNNNGIVSSRISMFSHTESESSNKITEVNTTYLQRRPTLSEPCLDETTINKFHNICNDVPMNPKGLIALDHVASTLLKESENNKNKGRRLLASKSEMDIFNRIDNKTDKNKAGLYKSCEDLPKVNVRHFISMFESVPKTESKNKDVLVRNISVSKKRNTIDSNILTSQPLSTTDTSPEKAESTKDSTQILKANIEDNKTLDINFEKEKSLTTNENVQNQDDAIQTELTDHNPESKEYKQRFKKAKQFFQSLEELTTNTPKISKLNECEMILYSKSTELHSECKQANQKLTVKAHSAPTSDCEYETSSIGDQWDGYGVGAGGRRLIKISEKFQVEDLFDDVAGEGKLSRNGSFRGIPNKRAVLAAFKSMENVTDCLTSYEMGSSPLSNFVEEGKNKDAQTYLAEYPYLPRTEPSKYRSRVDIRASGLISRSELLKHNPRLRRNSVPDALRLNEMFTATL